MPTLVGKILLIHQVVRRDLIGINSFLGIRKGKYLRLLGKIHNHLAFNFFQTVLLQRTPMHWNDEKNGGFSTADKTWLPMHPDYPTVNVEAQLNSTGVSHIKVYKQLSALRQTDVWRYGSLESQAPDNGALFGFSRFCLLKFSLFMQWW